VLARPCLPCGSWVSQHALRWSRQICASRSETDERSLREAVARRLEDDQEGRFRRTIRTRERIPRQDRRDTQLPGSQIVRGAQGYHCDVLAADSRGELGRESGLSRRARHCPTAEHRPTAHRQYRSRPVPEFDCDSHGAVCQRQRPQRARYRAPSGLCPLPGRWLLHPQRHVSLLALSHNGNR
jgi:hypothetical protein